MVFTFFETHGNSIYLPLTFLFVYFFCFVELSQGRPILKDTFETRPPNKRKTIFSSIYSYFLHKFCRTVV